MTREDLQQARKQLWRQDGAAVHTLEDARAWLDAMGWVRIHASNTAAAAPELVTAAAGGLLEDREEALAADRAAHSLLSRLVEQREAVPLVSEAAQVGATDSGDVLAARRMLPYFYALRGERSPKKAPSSSPLAKEIWQQLDEGSASALSLAGKIGGGITEGAVLRALRELWVQMRVAPLPAESEDAVTLWTRVDRTWSGEVKEGTQTAQPLALSALVSQYLQTAIAASEEELAAMLAPWSSRQRVKEILQALTAGRELQLVPVERTTHYALAGGKAEEMRLEADDRERAALKLAREEHQAKLALEAASAPAESADDAASPRSGVKKYVPREKREGRPFAGRREGGEGSFAPRKPFVRREESERGAFAERPPRGANPRKFSGERSAGPRKPFVKREGSERSFSDRKPFQKREGAERSFGPRKPFVKREGSERSFGDRKPFQKREGAERSFGPRKPFVKREGSERSFGDRKPFQKREGAERSFGPRKPFVKREGSERSFGDRKPFQKREGAERSFGPRKPFSARGGERPPGGDFKPRAPRAGDDRPRRDFVPRAREGAPRREWTPRPPRDGEDRPRREFKPRTEGDRPRRDFKPRGDTPVRESGERKFTPRSSPGARRPGGQEERSGGYKSRATGGNFKPRSAGGFAPRADGGKRFGSGPRKAGAGAPRKPGAGPRKFSGPPKPWQKRAPRKPDEAPE